MTTKNYVGSGFVSDGIYDFDDPDNIKGLISDLLWFATYEAVTAKTPLVQYESIVTKLAESLNETGEASYADGRYTWDRSIKRESDDGDWIVSTTVVGHFPDVEA